MSHPVGIHVLFDHFDLCLQLGFAVRISALCSSRSGLILALLTWRLAQLVYISFFLLFKRCCAEVKTVLERAFNNHVELLQVIFRFYAPMINSNRRHTSEWEQSRLLHRLVIRAKVLRRQNVSVDQGLQRIHPIKNNHCLALVKDRQIRYQLRWELV